MKIRLSKRADLLALHTVLTETELFPSDMLPEMITPFLTEQDCPELWLSGEMEEQVAGFCYAVPEVMTDGTWNLLAIAVLPSKQGLGLGQAIIRHLETMLIARGGRVLIIDTSSDAGFDKTRAIYRHCGFVEEARVRDFWAVGDDKVTYWKALG